LVKSHLAGGSDRTWSKVISNFSDLNGEGNIESMLAVETGLREIASLKVYAHILICLLLKKTVSQKIHISFISFLAPHRLRML